VKARESIEIAGEAAIDRRGVGNFVHFCDASAKNRDAPDVTSKHCLAGGLMCESVIYSQLCGLVRKAAGGSFGPRSSAMRSK
jgi:hypothetical protein